MSVLIRAIAGVLLAIGLALLGGGLELLTLHGSSYYLLCGIAIVASAALLWQRRGEGAALFGLMVLATLVWALWEAGYDGWALMPRIAVFTLLGSVLAIPAVRRSLKWRATPPSSVLVVVGIGMAVLTGVALHTWIPPHTPADPIYQAGTTSASDSLSSSPSAHQGQGDWQNYGNDPGGTRFSALAQIRPDNVARLKVAWMYRIGHTGPGLEVTPLKIDRTLYLCTDHNDLIALNAQTGRELWHFNVHAGYARLPVCRGVAYYRAAHVSGACAKRVITNTIDARLIAVDADDGKPCANFGVNGEVSLLEGLGKVVPGYYSVTSAPTVVRGKIVVGSMVLDNQYQGEPSGVIRAFDALSGQLAWAWDLGHPEQSTEPPPGGTYTRATPNAWAPMSADEDLGLVYAPTGTATGADSFGGQRRSFDERFGNSVIALDAETGKLRWSFQTSHHDLWDYDVSSPPTLVDITTRRGIAHALLQATKRGEMFVLDRATGAPLYPIEERSVPQGGHVPEEHLSPTQPFSTGLPSFRGADLVEGDMWGITPLDQLWCRIKFREARYEGPATPPGLTPAIQMPGVLGGMEWGGVAVDVTRGIAIVNSNHVPNYLRLILRSQADRLGLKRFNPEKRMSHAGAQEGTPVPQEGTPYGLLRGDGFLSPLDVPCSRPPYGRLSAVDLRTGKLIWTQVFGTARDIGPFGIPSLLPLQLGTPNIGGAVVTGSGLIFIGAAQDRYLRAYETATGKLRWQARLPAGGNATPITYLSPESGRQFVVIAAGGHEAIASKTGDWIIAYALP